MIRVTIIFGVLLLLSSFIVFKLAKRVADLKRDREQIIAFHNSDSSSVTFYKNKLGRESAKVQILELTLKSSREMLADPRVKAALQFNGVKKNLKNVSHVNSIGAVFDNTFSLGAGDTEVILGGSLTKENNFDDKSIAIQFTYKDSLNSLSGILIGDSISTIHVKSIVPIEQVLYWERNKFLGLKIGRKKWFSVVTSLNPAVTIKNVQTIKIVKQRG